MYGGGGGGRILSGLVHYAQCCLNHMNLVHLEFVPLGFRRVPSGPDCGVIETGSHMAEVLFSGIITGSLS